MSGIAINAPPLATPPLRPGDPAPWFLAPSPANACFSFATLGGRRILLAFVRSLSSQEGRTIAQAYWNATRDAPPNVTAVVIVTADPADAGVSPPQGVSASAILFDFERKAAALSGPGTGRPRS